MTTKETKSLLDIEERSDHYIDSSSLINENDGRSLNKEQQEVLIDNFFEKIGKNGRKVIEVSQYFVCDRDSAIKKIKGLSDLRGYTCSKLQITSIDTLDKPGFIRINKQIDIPLLTTRAVKFPAYYYDEDEAISFIHNENLRSYEAVEEMLNEFTKAASFLKEVVSQKLF